MFYIKYYLFITQFYIGVNPTTSTENRNRSNSVAVFAFSAPKIAPKKLN